MENCVARRMSEVEAAYVAGIVDGEGSIVLFSHVRPNGYRHLILRVSVVNTNKDLLDWLVSVTGCGRIGKMTQDAGHKLARSWELGQAEARDFLPQILPYLRIKKRQCELAIRYLEVRGQEKAIPEGARAELAALVDQCRALNRRGEWAEGQPEAIRNPVRPQDREPGICPACGKSVDRSHYAGKKYCDARCWDTYRNRRKPKVVPPELQCPMCPNRFRKRGRQKYCSAVCNQRAYVARKSNKERHDEAAGEAGARAGAAGGGEAATAAEGC